MKIEMSDDRFDSYDIAATLIIMAAGQRMQLKPRRARRWWSLSVYRNREEEVYWSACLDSRWSSKLSKTVESERVPAARLVMSIFQNFSINFNRNRSKEQKLILSIIEKSIFTTSRPLSVPFFWFFNLT